MAELYIATGAESSGKTTLCTRLARARQLPLVSEASRGYLEARLRLNTDYRYTPSDLLSIAQIQHAAETMSFDPDRLPLVCDTDLLVLIVWSEEKFGEVIPWISQTFNEVITRNNRHYLLCDWKIPWADDPLRENPDDRERLFNIYLEKLNNLSLPYTIISGDEEQRLAQAKALIAP